MPANKLRRTAGIVLAVALLGGLLVAGATAVTAQEDGAQTPEMPGQEEGAQTPEMPGQEEGAQTPEMPGQEEGAETPEVPGQDTQANQSTRIRIAHAVPDAPAVDVALDGETVLENVSFGTVSDYISIEPGVRQVTVTASNDSDQVFYDEALPVRPGTYTVAVAGESDENATQPITPVVLLDEATQPEQGQAMVRLAHLAPDAPAVDVTVAETNETLFENVSFANSTDYRAVPTGNYTLEVHPADADAGAEPVATVNVTLENQTAYTAFAVGYLNPDEGAGQEPFDVIVEDDSTTEGAAQNQTGPTPDIPVETVTGGMEG